jgi:O-6-methylguanine DNA methyltransferase
VAVVVRYEVEGWGVGELWFEDGRLALHELPRALGGTVPRKRPRPVRLGDRPSTERHPLAVRLCAYFGGARDSFTDVEIDLDGYTAFQRAVVEAVRAVTWGEVVTYGELAALAGHPNAQRAAGSVCAHNRFPLFIPCHRVVAADGIGQYGSTGIEYKRRLLELEGVAV